MATQAATFTTAQAADLRKTLAEFLARLNTEGNPDFKPAAATITTDTAGSITFALAATQGNPAYSTAVAASVA